MLVWFLEPIKFMPKVAIIILLYNGRQYLEDLLLSLKEQDYPQESCRIFLVDNASTDDSLEYIKINFPQFTIIKNEKNEGFPKGNNIGIKYALRENFDYIVLLNQDTVVELNWLRELISVAEKDKTIGSVQPLILFWNDKNKINSSGNTIHFLGFGYCDNFNQKKEIIGDSSEIGYASGAAVLLRVKVLKEIGLLDENLFYTEDLDLGWRIRLAGYKNFNAPKSVIYHKFVFNKNKDKYYFLEFGRIFTLLKNYQLFTLLLISPVLIFYEIEIVIYSLLKGWGILKLRSCKNIFLSLPILIKERKKIQEKRKIKDREICKYINGKIDARYEDFNNFLFRLINPLLNLYWKILCVLLI